MERAFGQQPCVCLILGLASAVYGDTSVPHVPFERFLELPLISLGLNEDKQVSKLALAIARASSLPPARHSCSCGKRG